MIDPTFDIKSQIIRHHKKNRQDNNQKNKRSVFSILFMWMFFLGLAGLMILFFLGVWYYYFVFKNLPPIETIQETKLSIPSQIYTKDNQLITEFGEKKRQPITFDEIPEQMIQAVIAAEDTNFFQHKGIDYKAIVRAGLELLKTKQITQGGSTITMQVIRNFLLTREKTFLRKMNEIFLAIKLEKVASKEEILTLYLNKIFFGYRSYGLKATAQTYYGKKPEDLTLDEIAMIAGLPKAPSAFNPIINPERAKIRRSYVLSRMQKLGFITEEEEQQANAQPVHAKLHTNKFDIEADYIAEMTRQFISEELGITELDEGLKIYTTIDSKLQTAAQLAVRNGLHAYSERHGYKGVIKNIDLNEVNISEKIVKELLEIKTYGDLEAGVVTDIQPQSAEVTLQNLEKIELTWESMSWASPFIDVDTKGKKIEKASDIFNLGDVIVVRQTPNEPTSWKLAQFNEVESGLISVNSQTGAIYSLVGGFDFHQSKFNRVTQANRQLGSIFKPFLYSAAFAKGYTAATLINDAPVVFKDKELEGAWKPQNYSGRSYGPTRLRLALAFSRNLVSIRLLQAIGVNSTVNYVKKFGFPTAALEQSKNLSLALGTLSLTMLDVTRAYMVFSNGGYLVEPYFVDRIENSNGELLYQAPALEKCELECTQIADVKLVPRVIDEKNNYLINHLLQDVIKYGTGKAANKLKRKDIAGKTGTTNDLKDAWFVGFTPKIVTTVWTGFDQPKTMGRREFGGRTSLPTWLEYMSFALADETELPFTQPNGFISMRVDKETGLPTSSIENSVFEIFRSEYAPVVFDGDEKTNKINNLVDQIF